MRGRARAPGQDRSDDERELFTSPAATPPQAVLALQRSAGNTATRRALAGRDGLITTAQLASNWNRARSDRPSSPTQPGTQFRLPTAAAIKAMLAGGTVPEDKVRASISTALTRMRKEKNPQLKTADPIPDIMVKLFPGPGVFDEKEFAKIVDEADRKKIYVKASDAEAKLTAADKAKLIIAMGEASKMIDKAVADAKTLKLVFGTRHGDAKANYTKAKAALGRLKLNLDTNVHTDYNRDDEQVGLGGWANFASQMVHLEPDVAAAKDPTESALTILHECAHLADPAVMDDGGYYPGSKAKSAGWEAMTEDEKVNNAAHYEEIPRRQLGIGVYGKDEEFKPGVSASGGGALSFQEKVHQEARQFLRKAWDAAVDTHLGIRKVRVDIEKGSSARFNAKKARILEISRICKLTIHDQTPAPSTVNLNDVVLMEGVARGTAHIGSRAGKQAVPAIADVGKTQSDHAQEVVAAAAKDYGALTGNPADDKTLLDWMVANYQSVGL